jgi:hypothetical protein
VVDVLRCVAGSSIWASRGPARVNEICTKHVIRLHHLSSHNSIVITVGMHTPSGSVRQPGQPDPSQLSHSYPDPGIMPSVPRKQLFDVTAIPQVGGPEHLLVLSVRHEGGALERARPRALDYRELDVRAEPDGDNGHEQHVYRGPPRSRRSPLAVSLGRIRPDERGSTLGRRAGGRSIPSGPTS